MVRARPETVQSRRDVGTLRSDRLRDRGERLCTGVGVGDAAADGPAQVIESAREIGRGEEGLQVYVMAGVESEMEASLQPAPGLP